MTHLLLILAAALSLDAQLAELDTQLELSSEYDRQYEQHIDSLRQKLSADPCSFELTQAMVEAYASYQFDSTYAYVLQLEKLAQAGTREQKMTAKLNKAFAYFSAGLFKEAYDELDAVTDIETYPLPQQQLYYARFARLCFDMGTYSGNTFYQHYTQMGLELLRRQIDGTLPSDTIGYEYACALRDLKMERYAEAMHHFQQALQCSTLDSHMRAIIYSTMAHGALMQGQEQLSLQYLIEAAIDDARSSINEGVALRLVASQLHDMGYCNQALRYINLALQDANFYGARHRQLEASMVLPIIEHEKHVMEEHLHRRVTILILCISIIMIILLLVLLFLHREMRILHRTQNSNQDINRQLNEMGRIKEHYIGTFLAEHSDAIREAEQVQTNIRKLVRDRDWKALEAYQNHIPHQNRRQEFMKSFDEMFLRICPHFVEDFNALLLPEYQVVPKKGELLTTELRIFALMRLGITTNEKIAQVLDYSLNTVYTYKTKMRSRSLLNSDAFYDAVLHLGQD
ncbi:MAG: DUF6377 domain-containing protein [Paludibacteraceae bacterium]|nr:DUF6377 domain-containing protein [Paludibacteraceae bacterium]